MAKLSKTLLQVSLLALALVLAACTATPVAGPAEPTADLNAVRTEAVQTAVAQLTLEAALNPTATAIVMPSATALLPTSTLMTLPTLPPIPTATRPAGGGGGGGGGGVAAATATSYTDAAQVLGTAPIDGTYMDPGYDFDVTWTVKNVGKRAWTKDFYIRYVSGVPGKTANIVMLPATGVAVNDTVTITVDMLAPLQPGNYGTTWYLINDDAVAFQTLSLVFTVRQP